MSVARRDDRHNEDLVNEISDSFNRAVGAKRSESDEEDEPQEQRQPQFVVTGDNRSQRPKNRWARYDQE